MGEHSVIQLNKHLGKQEKQAELHLRERCREGAAHSSKGSGRITSGGTGAVSFWLDCGIKANLKATVN